METTRENLELCVKRTFFHVKDADVEAFKMCASNSDPSSDFSNRGCSSASTEALSGIASNPTGPQLQQGSPSSSMQVGEVRQPRGSASSGEARQVGEVRQPRGSASSGEVRQPRGEQLGDLLGDQPPPRSMSEDRDGPDVSFWSVGAELHQSGQCRPCAWFYKSKGCTHGSACNYCHVCPEGQVRGRRKEKDAQLRQQRIVENQREALPTGRVGSSAQSSHAGGHEPEPHPRSSTDSRHGQANMKMSL